MAEGQSGISAGELHNAISSLRSELMQHINSVQSELHSEIRRLEAEMREIGQMIASAIQKQTNELKHQIEIQTGAVVGGVAATTFMLERTKTQIEEDFSKTRNRLELQTEANLQIEVGKKMADSVSTHGKLMAFAKDIEHRFEKSIEGFYLNRQLYNENFKKIFDEYSNKLRTIGQHIFFIRDNDIAPAIEAAQAPLDQIHGLPMEVDLYRLKVRAENLDDVLKILKDSRFDKILKSVESLEGTLDSQYGISNGTAATTADEFSSVVLTTYSPIGTDILVGRNVRPVSGDKSVNFDAAGTEFAAYESKKARAYLLAAAEKLEKRNPTPNEMGRLMTAAARLSQRKLISEDAVALLEDFFGSGNLKLVR